MNISVINIRKFNKIIITLVFGIIVYACLKAIIINISVVKDFFTFELCSKLHTNMFYQTQNNNDNSNNNNEQFNIKIIKASFPILAYNSEKNENEENIIENKNNESEEIKIEKNAKTEQVSDRNIEESYNYTYESIKIKNQSNYNLQEENINPDSVKLINKKIIIYHTHTCESYTPSEKYSYSMTGNYRTTDNNFNVVRVGLELEKYLKNKGFTVIHDTTYHDYPSYNGSYDRSFETVSEILTKNSDASMIIDLHRDAVGDGSWYGPTILVDGKSTAQMMFVMRNRWWRINTSKLEGKFENST